MKAVHGILLTGSAHLSKVLSTRVTGNVEIIPDRIRVSDYNFVSRMQRFSSEPGGRLYGWEKDLEGNKWAWSKDKSVLHIKNHSLEATLANIEFESTSLENLS